MAGYFGPCYTLKPCISHFGGLLCPESPTGEFIGASMGGEEEVGRDQRLAEKESN